MAYTINKFDRSFLAAVEDGTIDRTTDLQFVGKNFAGYGEIQNENFLYLLENFAGGNPPPRAIRGQLWYDSSTRKIKVYDTAIWKTLGVTQVSATAPSGLREGDCWWDSANGQLYTYNGTAFELIGPEKAGSNTTRMVSSVVQDTIGNERPVVQAVVNGQTQFVISEFEFTLNTSTPITGFDTIKKGITLVDTTSSNGITNPATTWLWGTASNAELLDGLNNTQFLRSDQDTSLAGEFNLSTDNTGINWDSGNINIKANAASGSLNFVTRSADTVVFDAAGTETVKINPTGGQLGLTYLGNVVWHQGNQGSGSGLDADLLDGFDHTDFLKVNAKAVDSDLLDGLNSDAFLQRTGGVMTGDIQFTDDAEGISWSRNSDGASIRFYNTDDSDTNSRLEFQTTDNGNEYFAWTIRVTGDPNSVEIMKLDPSNAANGLTYRGQKVWHEGNDGSGSGLDADTLDGLNSTDFLEVDGKAVSAFTADNAINANNANTVGGVSQDAFFRKTGGAVSGFITLHADPTHDNHAATKRYIDTVVGNIDPYWAGATTFANVAATYSSFPVNTRVSFWEERSYSRSANSNGGSVHISDRYRRTIKKTGANTWVDVGG